MPTKTTTAAQAALFERGYPYLVRLIDGHPDDAPKVRDKKLKKLIAATDPVYVVDWPASVAAGFAHAFASRRFERTGTYPSAPPGPEVVEPWIAEAITRRSVAEGGLDYGYEMRSFLFLLEAWHGTDPVLLALVSAYEKLAVIEAGNKQCKNYAADEALLALSALLLRAGDAASGAARQRLAAVLEVPKVCDCFVFRDLDMVLGGRAGLLRQNFKYVYPQVFLFSEDADLIHEGVTQYRGADLEPRALWLGGDVAFAHQLEHARKVPAATLGFMIESLAMFDTPAVVPLMLLLGAKKNGDAAMAWLSAHPELVAPQLDDLRRAKGALGKAAKAFNPGAAPAGVAAAPEPVTLADAEKQLDELVDWVVAEIKRVRGKKAAEAAVWVEAAERYIAVRSSMDEPGEEYLGHFFMVDGVGLERDRETAWDRLGPTAAESKRWGKALDRDA